MKSTLFIYYVLDQKRSAGFYKKVLLQQPILDVDGMTEFKLCDGSSLGLMPVKNIKKLLGDKLPDPSQRIGIPGCELYLLVDDPIVFHRRAIENGAVEISPLQQRDWGDDVAYSLDPDGHVVAFARKHEAAGD